MKNIDWDDLRYFLCVARGKGLTHAARELGVSQSTVARRISNLEKSLGAGLFARHATGYFLTDQGHTMMAKAQPIEENILSLTSSISDRETLVSGVVRLATAETLAVNLLIPALPALLAKYPRLQLEIVTGIELINLARYEADVAIRLARPTNANVVVQRVGVMNSAVYAAPELKRRITIEPNNKIKGPFIIWDRAFSHLPTAKWLHDNAYDVAPALVTTSVLTQYAAAKAGIGLAVLPCFLAANDDQLIEVVPTENVFSEEVWLAIHPDQKNSLRIRLVIDFIKQLLEGTEH